MSTVRVGGRTFCAAPQNQAARDILAGRCDGVLVVPDVPSSTRRPRKYRSRFHVGDIVVRRHTALAVMVADIGTPGPNQMLFIEYSCEAREAYKPASYYRKAGFSARRRFRREQAEHRARDLARSASS